MLNVSRNKAPDSVAPVGNDESEYACPKGFLCHGAQEYGNVEEEGYGHWQHDWCTETADAEHKESVEYDCLGAVSLVTAEQQQITDAEEGSCNDWLFQRMHERETSCQHKPNTRHHTGTNTDNMLLGVGLHHDVGCQQAKYQTQNTVNRESPLRKPPQSSSYYHTNGKREDTSCYFILESVVNH